MKRLMIAAALTTLTPAIHSAPIFQPYGPNLSYGGVSNGQTVLSTTTNPAAPAEKLESSGESWSMGVFPHFGVGAEYGDVDNLFTEIDETANTIQQNSQNYTLSAQSANELNNSIADANRIIDLVEQGGYGKAITSLQMPMTPVSIGGIFGGSLFFDVNGFVTGRMGALTETINFDAALLQQFLLTPTPTNIIGDVTLDYDIASGNFTATIRNDTTAVLKAAGVAEMGLGYSRKFLGNNHGKLYGGVKGKYYQVRLVRDIEKLSDIQEGSEDFFDNFDFDNAEVSSGFGLDFGVIWAAESYHLGATVTDINEPSFKYNNLDISGKGYENQRIIDALTADETYTMKRQLKLEAAKYFFSSKNLVLSAAFDANAIEDPTGDEYQWANASIAYITDSWIIPGARLGYRKNMAGSELSYIEGGFTWLFVNIDGGMALEDVEVDGESYPRSVYVNLGIEWSF